jgi:thiamine-phosphate diphosphorylase
VTRRVAEGIYLVTDTALCGTLGVPATVDQAVAAGVRTVQIRDKNATTRQLYDLVVRVAEAVDGRATLLVDDRVDVFLAARADGVNIHGVHVGQSDLDPSMARRLAGEHAIIGLTANTLDHLAEADALPPGTVDYLGIGVIRPTLTKPGHPKPLGVDGFEALARATRLPCVAIGGIGENDLPAIRRAGATGAAVVSAICGQPDPFQRAAALLTAWAR